MKVASPAHSVDQTFIYIVAVALFFLLIITGFMIYFLVRYRRSRHPISVDIRGNIWLELLWTVVPTAIALALFYLGWHSYIALRNVPPGTREITVTARMFVWEFTYPEGFTRQRELVVPVGSPIKLILHSEDVIHSLFIPTLRTKIDAVPGMQTYTWFLPEQVGEFDLLCAEYCGTGHWDMSAKLRVLPEGDYQDWITKQQQDGGDDDEQW